MNILMSIKCSLVVCGILCISSQMVQCKKDFQVALESEFQDLFRSIESKVLFGDEGTKSKGRHGHRKTQSQANATAQSSSQSQTPAVAAGLNSDSMNQSVAQNASQSTDQASQLPAASSKIAPANQADSLPAVPSASGVQQDVQQPDQSSADNSTKDVQPAQPMPASGGDSQAASSKVQQQSQDSSQGSADGYSGQRVRGRKRFLTPAPQPDQAVSGPLQPASSVDASAGEQDQSPNSSANQQKDTSSSQQGISSSIASDAKPKIASISSNPQTQTIGVYGQNYEATVSVSKRGIRAAKSPVAQAVPAVPVSADTAVQSRAAPVVIPGVKSQKPGGRTSVVSRFGSDDDSDGDDDDDMSLRLQPDMYRVFVQMAGTILPQNCQSDAECASLPNSICSRFLAKCVPAPADKSKVQKCGPQVCSSDGDCCSGEVCDSYAGLLTIRRCRSADSIAKGNIASSKSKSSSNSSSSAPVAPASVASASGRSLDSSDAQPMTPPVVVQNSSVPVSVNSSIAAGPQQSASASRTDMASGQNPALQSGVSVSSSAGVGSQQNQTSSAMSGGGPSISGADQDQDNQAIAPVKAAPAVPAVPLSQDGKPGSGPAVAAQSKL